MSLSKTSVGMAQIVSQSLQNKGIELSAVNDTPVQVLTDLSTQQLIIDEGVKAAAGGFERPELSVSLLSGADEPLPGQVDSAHTQQLAESSALLSRVLNGALDLAQNTVNPMIDRVVKKIGETISQTLEATASPLEIVQQRPDPIFDSVYLQESSARYRTQGRDINLRSLGLNSSYIAGNVKALMATGHSGMDAQVSDFVDRVGDDFIISVWDQIFGAANSNSMQVYGRPSQAREAVAAYFLAAYALQNVPSGLNIDLSEYRDYCSQVLASAGAAICGSYEDRAQQRKHGRLVLTYPMDTTPVGAVVVDGDKYVEWLAQGGSPEALFATVYGDRNFDSARMIERKASLEQDWARVMMSYQSVVSTKRFDAAVAGLRAQMTSEINAIPDDQLIGDRGAYHDRLRERLRHAKLRDLDHQWHWARKAVCRVIFPHTDAESLLLGIDEQSKVHPDKQPRELALYATIDLVARWLVNQLARQYH
ncbi:hypothetical protein [Xanthomonas phage RTH11]|nr:hypothetical protein [Xanthomonas phage RTH11]